MDVSSALRVAINLHLMPMQSTLVRKAPLPDGVIDLLRIAAGEEKAISRAALATERSREDIEQAAAFFIETILLAQDSSSYRVLGVHPNASSGELRKNMALITRYLHPDLDVNNERSKFITRVTSAWNDLKTAEKRAAYDRRQKNNKRLKKRVPASRSRARRKLAAGKKRLGKNGVVPLQPLSRKQRWRGAVLRYLTLLVMKVSGRS